MSECFVKCVRDYIRDNDYFDFATGLLHDSLPQEVDGKVLEMLEAISNSLSELFLCEKERAEYFLFSIQRFIKEAKTKRVHKKEAKKANASFIKKGEDFLKALSQLTPNEQEDIHLFSTITDEMGREITPKWVICRMLCVAMRHEFTRDEVIFRENESVGVFAVPLQKRFNISNVQVRTLLVACGVPCEQKQVEKAIERGDKSPWKIN